jgi:hypothetical protein
MALEDYKLPEDVLIGHIRYYKGVSLATLVNAARRWHAQCVAVNGISTQPIDLSPPKTE